MNESKLMNVMLFIAVVLCVLAIISMIISYIHITRDLKRKTKCADILPQIVETPHPLLEFEIQSTKIDIQDLLKYKIRKPKGRNNKAGYAVPEVTICLL